jgi:hypothetical protein
LKHGKFSSWHPGSHLLASAVFKLGTVTDAATEAFIIDVCWHVRRI